jgi:hypothetical protein
VTGGDTVPGSAGPEGEVPRSAGPEGDVPGSAGPGGEVPVDAHPDDDSAPAAEPTPDGEPAPDEESAAVLAPTGEPVGEETGLDAVDREILALENLQWKYQGAKEMEIRRRLHLSPTHYYQRLNVLIDTRAALEHDPMLVARLRRQRGDHG